MDRGAARSRKRTAKAAQAPVTPVDARGGAVAGPSSKPNHNEKRSDRPEKKRKERIRPGEQSTDPALYRPKAIRTSAALIYSESPFALPPPKESLENVRRVDLSGSGVTDVSWLEGMGVTWLSLAGCKVEQGWEAVGSLTDLSVLNISGCGLTTLPPALGAYKKLKAIVAMNNDWTRLDSQVISSWTELNSLIVSHSPNLTSLPSSLATLYHLSKLTFSHCPRLTASGLPDLSPLPSLRDVKMNNLPLLTSLPPHISSWGKGDLSLVKGQGKDDLPSTVKRLGDGLEVLDLGNCSLPFTAISQNGLAPSTSSSLKSAKPLWPHLRSLSLHSNPLTTTHPNYVELLQSSKDLPNLQIIDAKRVVERKKKGEISESKHDKRQRENKEKKMRPSGANVASTGGKARQWGGEGEAGKGKEREQDERAQEIDAKEKKDKKDKEKKEKRKTEGEATHPHKKRRHEDIDLGESKRRKKDERPAQPSTAPVPPTATTTPAIDPTELRQPVQPDSAKSKGPKGGKNVAAVLGVIEVKRAGEDGDAGKKKKKAKKGKDEVKRGVDLRELFGKSTAVNEEGEAGEQGGSGLGLGVGGW